VYCGRFQRAKKSTALHKTPFTKHLQNTTKHRKNTAKVKLCRKTTQNNNAKRSKMSQNGRNTAAIRIARIRCILQKYFRPVAKVHNVTGGVTYLRRGSRFKKKQCFAVFCGVLRCFVCVFLAFFTKQTKTDQKYTKRTKRTKYALCNTAQYGAVRLSLTQKMSTKNIRKTRPKHCKTSAKHRKTPQNTVFQKTLAKHHKTPAKHPQNTAKHRKTPQNRFANKTDQIS